MTLLQSLYVMAAALAPSAPHTYQAPVVLAEIASVVGQAKHPIFATKEQDAAVMLVQAWSESNFMLTAVGDHGRALCAYQLQNAPHAVLTSPWLCTKLAYDRLRLSVAACPQDPLAPYIGGCTNRTARARSRQRLAEALRVLSVVETSKRLLTLLPPSSVEDTLAEMPALHDWVVGLIDERIKSLEAENASLKEDKTRLVKLLEKAYDELGAEHLLEDDLASIGMVRS